MLSLIDFLWKTDNINRMDELSVLLDDFLRSPKMSSPKR